MIRFLDWYISTYKGLSRDTWFLSFVALINRSGTVVFLFLSIYMVEKLGFTMGQAAIVLSLSGVGSFIGSFIGGILTDRFGYYRVMFYSLILTGLMFFILLKVTTFIPFCIVLTLSGIIGETFRPASGTSLSVYANKENQTRALSLYRLAINLGFVVGSASAGLIAGRIGYDWLFIIDGVTCILSAFFFIATLKDKESILDEEKKENEGTIALSPYKDTWYLLYLFSLSFCGIAFMQIFESFPLFCTSILGYGEEAYGAFMSYNGLLICMIEMPLIYLIVQYKKETPSIIWGVVFFGLSYPLFNLLGGSWIVILIFMTVFVLAEILNFPLTYKVPLNRSHPKTRGQYMGLFSMMYSLVAIISPFGLKFAETYGFDSLWYLCGVLCAISTVGLILLRKGLNKHVET